ncbi:hypothetical protein GH733_003497 [Mirounga leonina]|nr:hypothetical protein GH733_003497 [Mirounga leonina]
MGAVSVWALGLLMFQVLLFVAGEQSTQDVSAAASATIDKGLHMQKVGSGLVRAALAELVALPCLFTLRPWPGAAREAPRIKWTKVRTASGQRQDLPILVAKDNVVRVAKGWQGRVSLPAYPRHRANATLLLGPLRASDSGLYRCQVVRGIEDEQDLVPLEVTGVVFHYRAAQDRYALTFAEAQEACRLSSATIAAPRHLQAAFEDGFDNCDAGWLSDRTVRYPITQSRPGCYGDRSSLPGVRSYGRRDPQELYDVYCFARELGGEVFYVGPARRLTLAGARAQCRRQGAALASVGQLHLAWHEGLDQCDPGWLADGSVRYPIQTPRRRCGGPAPGVRTVYRFANRTGFPAPGERFDAYCFRAHHPTPHQHGDPETPSSGDEGEILSAEGPPAQELEPSTREETITPDFQEPLVSSGDEEPLILAGKQESQETPSPAPGGFTLVSRPSLEAEEVWLSTAAPSPSSPSTAVGTNTEATPTGPIPRRRGRFKGLNGRHFQQQEPQQGLEMGLEASTQPPTPEAAGNHVELPLATGATDASGSSQSQSPWAVLTNEVDVPEAGSPGGRSPPEPWLWPPTVVPPSIPGPSRVLGLTLEEAKGPSVRPATPDLPLSPSESTVLAPSPSEGPSTASWEVSPMVSSPDLPLMAMLRAPKLWLQPHPTSLPTQADSVTGHSEAMAAGPPSPASETEAVPQDPIHLEVHSLSLSSVPTGQGREATSPTVGSHRAGRPVASSRTATDTQAGASPHHPRANFGETGGTSPTGLSKAELPRSSPQASVDKNVAEDFTPTETATEPTGVRDISESGSGVVSTAESSSSSSQATVDEAQGTWPSLHSEGLDSRPPSAPSGGPRVLLIPGVTPSSEPWAAINGEAMLGPTDSTATLDASDAGGIWEHGSHGVEGTESPTLSPQVAVDSSMAMSLLSLEQGDKVGVLAMSTVASSSSQPHPEPEGQTVTPGTLGALAPSHDSSPQREPVFPSWTPTAVSVDKPASVSSGEPTVPGDSPSTPPPASLGPEEFELEVLAGSPGVEGFWEEAASGEEPTLPGTPANGSAEEAPLDPCENNPCLHGGSCKVNGTMYGCSCDQGFAGENCEIDIDECVSSPCKNGGTCIDEVNTFVCLCLPSYGGSLCEKGFGRENTWIGLNDRIVERDFQWTDNTGLQYENWRENQPDNFFAGGEDCVVMVAHESGRWNDVPCNYNLPYVCKKGTVLCGPPPAVQNASPIGARKAKYNVHATVRYQCDEGFTQHHVAVIRCRSNGKWDQPQIVCTKPRRSHRMRRHHHHHQHHHQHHHHKSRKERRKHKRHPVEDWEKEEGNFC